MNKGIYNSISYFNNQPHILSHIMNHRLQGKVLDNKISS